MTRMQNYSVYILILVDLRIICGNTSLFPHLVYDPLSLPKLESECPCPTKGLYRSNEDDLTAGLGKIIHANTMIKTIMERGQGVDALTVSTR